MNDYLKMWNEALVDTSRKAEIDSISSLCLGYWPLYEAVKAQCGVPEYITACLDYREESFDHTCYLANGDPLFNSDGVPMKTYHVPKGLGPAKSWVEGAVLSLGDAGLVKHVAKAWSSIADVLFHLEAYNGLGYEHHGRISPYLWSGTSLYKSGKYVSDGVYDNNFVDKQLGCVPILRALQFKGISIPNS